MNALLIGSMLCFICAALIIASIIWDLRGMSGADMAMRLEAWTHRNPEQFLTLIGCVGLLVITVALCAAKSFEMKDHAVRENAIIRRLELIK